MNQFVEILIITYSITSIGLSFWAYSSIAFKRRMNNKFIWMAILLMFPPIGAFAYFQTRPKRRFNPQFKIQ